MLERRHIIFLSAAFGVIALYFFLRLYNILNLPLFTDEAIYIRWAQIAEQDANWRFISLVDGKQPMYVWMAMVFLQFVKEPLLAGRLVSVLAGLFTTIGLFFLANEMFRKSEEGVRKVFSFTKQSVSVGLLSSFIYVIFPFGLVYDRMALYDSLVASFAVWALYLLVVLVRSLRLDIALISGLVIGGGILTKTNAFFSIYSIPFLLIIFNWSKKSLNPRLINLFGLSAVVVILAYGMYSIMRLSPFYHIVGEKNALFVYPIGEWVKHPFTYFWSNLYALLDWLITYFKVPALLLVLLSFIIKRDHFREKTLLALWFLFPFMALSFFGNTIYPRFIFFMTIPLIPLVAYSLYELFEKYKNNLVRAAVLIFVFGLYLHADYFILFNFARTPIPKADLGQYVNGWSAGNGVRQSVEFFREQAANQKIYIVTQGTFGLMPYGLEMYLVDNPNIKILALWPIKDLPPKEVIDAAKIMPTYAIFYQPCPPCENSGHGGRTPLAWKAKLIVSYRQGTSADFYSIYQILP